MTECPGYSCTTSQQGETCPRSAPGGENGPFRCCNNKMISGAKPGDPAPNCTERASFPFGPSGAQSVVLCR